MCQNLSRLLQPSLKLDLNFSKKPKHHDRPQFKLRANRTFALSDISNSPSYDKLTQSITCLDSTRRDSLVDANGDTDRDTDRDRECAEDITQIVSTLDVQDKDNENITQHTQDNGNEMIPGIKFGRFFGTIQDATKRTIARRISQRQNRPVKTQGSVQDQMSILRQTITILNNNQQPSQTQKYLLNKISTLNTQLSKLSTEHPILQKQNKQLKQQNRLLRTTSNINQTKSEWWEKYSMQKDIEVIRKINSNYVTQMRMVNMSNYPSRGSSRSMIIRSQKDI